MNIEDTNKISNLDVLNTKYNFKILELEGINLDDDWSKLSKLKNLETLILKDSFIISLDKLDFDEESSLYVLYQGCSEAGFCYPVQKNYLRQ